jgi:hypothetical protein
MHGKRASDARLAGARMPQGQPQGSSRAAGRPPRSTSGHQGRVLGVEGEQCPTLLVVIARAGIARPPRRAEASGSTARRPRGRRGKSRQER